MKKSYLVWVFVLLLMLGCHRQHEFTWYSQRDGRWSHMKMGTSGLKVGRDGCSMTCFAMLLQQETTDPTRVSPSDLNKYLNDHSGYDSNGNINWTIADDMDGNDGVEWCENNFEYNNWSYIDEQLACGRKLIAQVDVQASPGIHVQHFVVIYDKIDDSGNPKSYLINDPWFEKFTTLEPYSWGKNGIIVFSTRSFQGKYDSD